MKTIKVPEATELEQKLRNHRLQWLDVLIA